MADEDVPGITDVGDGEEDVAGITDAGTKEQPTGDAAEAAKADDAEGKGAGAGTKKEEAADPLDTVPEEYGDPTVPEGFQADEGLVGAYKEMASTLKLTKRQYDELPKFLGGIFETIDKAVEGQRLETVAGWQKSLKADTVLSTDAGRANVARARDAFAAANPERAKEVLEVLKTTGMEYHPGLYTLLHWVGQQLGEGRMGPADAQGGQKKDLAATLFPRSVKRAS